MVSDESDESDESDDSSSSDGSLSRGVFEVLPITSSAVGEIMMFDCGATKNYELCSHK